VVCSCLLVLTSCSSSTAPRDSSDAGSLPAARRGSSATTTVNPGVALADDTSTHPRVPVGGVGCSLVKSDVPGSVALCETFDGPEGVVGTRTGDLNPVLWGVSRTATGGAGLVNVWRSASLAGCGALQLVVAPNDVRVCGGRLLDAVSDGGGQTTLAMYPKQPFDVAGRTGTVGFDVSADSERVHAAWPEFWWTDQPVPAPKGYLTTERQYAKNSFGFSLAGQCTGDVAEQEGGTAAYVGVDQMMVTRSSVFADLDFTRVGCVLKGSPTGALNHFEVRVNQSRVEVWGGDPGSSSVRLLAFADNANLTLTRGVVWLEDVHYNACKFDTQCDHTFAWDNLAFDGPAPYRDLTFDVPDASGAAGDGGVSLGYDVESSQPTVLQVQGVYQLQAPTKALIGFNWFPVGSSVPSVRVNGGPWHDTAWPQASDTYAWKTIAVDVPVSEIRSGTNTLEFKDTNGTTVANVNIILIAASPALS
jgi:hypothetical protein